MNESFSNSKTILKYNPQLDGLRFCAVLFVASYHWIPEIQAVKESFFFGGFVNFFFVLSSYLITRVLFSAKEKCIRNNIPRYKVIPVFLLRRTIRIFPAYYFFLLMVLFLPTIGSEIRNNSATYFTYLSNFQVFQSQTWPGVTAHFWTLAVEEQFYLLWPWLIVFMPTKHLLKTFVSIIIISTILKALCYHPIQVVPQDILTQYCMSAFAVGGVLAYKYTAASDKEKKLINKCSRIIIYAGMPFGILIIFYKSYYFSFVFNRLLFSVISMKIIEGAVIGYKNYLGKFLENKIALYLGKISYGIYLYHLLIPAIFWKLYEISYGYSKIHYTLFFAHCQKEISAFEHILSSDVVCFVIYAALTIAMASFSWKFIEKPAAKLKQYIGFVPSKATANYDTVSALTES